MRMAGKQGQHAVQGMHPTSTIECPSQCLRLWACRALLVGEQTLGKGVVQYFFPGESKSIICIEPCTSWNSDAASPPCSNIKYVFSFLPVHGDGGLKLTVSPQSLLPVLSQRLNVYTLWPLSSCLLLISPL